MGNSKVDSKVVMLEMDADQYRHLELASQKLGYSVPEFLLLSGSLMGGAIVNGYRALRTPLDAGRSMRNVDDC